MIDDIRNIWQFAQLNPGPLSEQEIRVIKGFILKHYINFVFLEEHTFIELIIQRHNNYCPAFLETKHSKSYQSVATYKPEIYHVNENFQ